MKYKIHTFLVDEIKQKIKELLLQIEDIQNSVNQEGKSSAGDKHETGRAMAQLEVEQCSKLLQEKELMLQQLLKMNTSEKHFMVGMGSLIECEEMFFFISLGFGKRIIDNNSVFCVGIQSPIYNELKGKKVGENFQFMNKKHLILNIN
jgi:hypothetical protein